MPLPAKKETRTKGENWMGYCDFFIMAVWWMCLYALQYEANLVYSCNSVVIEIYLIFIDSPSLSLDLTGLLA
jgi:hypothetical protein